MFNNLQFPEKKISIIYYGIFTQLLTSIVCKLRKSIINGSWKIL